jgi:hypothetical protein
MQATIDTIEVEPGRFVAVDSGSPTQAIAGVKRILGDIRDGIQMVKGLRDGLAAELDEAVAPRSNPHPRRTRTARILEAERIE